MTTTTYPRCTLYRDAGLKFGVDFQNAPGQFTTQLLSGPHANCLALLDAFAAAGVHTIDYTAPKSAPPAPAPVTSPDAADQLAADLAAGKPCGEPGCPRCPAEPKPLTEADKAYAAYVAALDAELVGVALNPILDGSGHNSRAKSLSNACDDARDVFFAAALRERYAAK